MEILYNQERPTGVWEGERAMEQQREMEIPQEEDLIYALDIGTRSVIGMLGKVKEGKEPCRMARSRTSARRPGLWWK